MHKSTSSFSRINRSPPPSSISFFAFLAFSFPFSPFFFLLSSLLIPLVESFKQSLNPSSSVTFFSLSPPTEKIIWLKIGKRNEGKQHTRQQCCRLWGRWGSSTCLLLLFLVFWHYHLLLILHFWTIVTAAEISEKKISHGKETCNQ